MVTLHPTRQARQTRYGLFDWLAAGFLVLIPVVVFWYVWARYAVNIPKYEDHALKAFLFNLDAETSATGKLYRFFQQHNEHRIVYDRFITWLDFNLSGKLNYVHLMVVGNVSLLGLLTIFGRVIRQSLTDSDTLRPAGIRVDGLLYVAPVAFLLFNLSHWENMFWGMAALQNFTIMLWVFWTIYLLTFPRSTPSALVLATIATLTSGNGLLIWPVGFVILLAHYFLEGRSNLSQLISWTLGALIVIGAYFLDYIKPPGNPPTNGSVTDLLKGWFAFNGAAAEAFPLGTPFTNCLLLGGIVSGLTVGIWLSILKKRLRHCPLSSSDYFFASSAAFLLGTAALVAWSRVGFGLNLLITSRYKIYSLLLLALVYTFAVVKTRPSVRKWVFGSGLLFSLVVMLSSYRAYLDETVWWRHYLLTSQFNWTYSTNRPVAVIDPNTAHWIDNAPGFYDNVVPTFYTPSDRSLRPFTSVAKSNSRFVVIDTASVNPVGTDAGTYLLVRSAKRVYLFQTTPVLNTSWKARFGVGEPFRKGLTGSIAEADLDPETYQIDRLLVYADGRIERHPTGQTITATPQVRRDIQKNW